MEIHTAATAPHKPWSILLYGPPKSGKTVFAAGAPDPLIIMTDIDGEISLRNHPELANVQWTLAHNYADVVKVLKELKKDKPPFKTIILDTLSGLQETQRLEQAGIQLGDTSWKLNEHIYTVNNFRLTQIVRALLELKQLNGYNLLFLAHLKEELVGSQENRRVLVRPTLSPALLGAVAAHVNGFFSLENKGADERQLKVKGNALHMAESRYKFPKDIYKNPTWAQILEVLEK